LIGVAAGERRRTIVNEADPEAQEYVRMRARLIAKAWLDPEFRQRLITSPAEVMEEEGMYVPPGVEVKVLEGADDVRYFYLPAKPPSLEENLMEEQLTLMQTGRIFFTATVEQCCDESHVV
jgi:hypothetical protein